MKKSYIKYSILVWVWMVLWVIVSNIWNVFGAQDLGQTEPNTAESIINTGCIEYTTSSWTGIKCDNAIVYYKTWASQEYKYFIQKRQKTWSMTNFTTWDVFVQSGEYIQYRVNFGSITWTCKKWTIEDRLPSCVKYVSSSIVWVTSATLTTGEHLVQYTNFRLNSGSSWYILLTGQIIANTPECVEATRYVNTWWFMCKDPHSNWIYSSVVARRQWGWQGWSGVVFTKSWNKTEMVPGETWLVFTLTVVNNWPNNITWVTIDDIWPNPNGKNCIIFEGWSWSAWSRDGNAYTRHYTKNNWVIRSKGGSATLQLFASIDDEPYCKWSYINTWKLTYHELWNTYTLTGYHQFKVVDAWTQYDVSIEKTVLPNGYVTHWGSIKYTIKYTNTWKKPLTGFWIKDYWPKEQVQFDRSTPSPTTTGNWDVIGWYFTWPLAPNDYWIITIQGTVN